MTEGARSGTYAKGESDPARPRAKSARSKCRSCNADIIWTVTRRNGKPMPVDFEPTDDGDFVLDREGDGSFTATKYYARIHGDRPRRKSHFASCPNASKHRRGR